MGLLRMLLTDAVTDHLIGSLPMGAPGRRRDARRPATKRVGVAVAIETVLKICQRLNAQDALKVLTAACTGMRWGEIAGMRRRFLVLVPADDGERASGYYIIDKEIGALKERNGRRYFGTPKCRPDKDRIIELPAFLVALLLDWMGQLSAKTDLLTVHRRARERMGTRRLPATRMAPCVRRLARAANRAQPPWLRGCCANRGGARLPRPMPHTCDVDGGGWHRAVRATSGWVTGRRGSAASMVTRRRSCGPGSSTG